jgi:hypothetical protein
LEQEQEQEQEHKDLRFGFASPAASPYDDRVLELEVYAAGVPPVTDHHSQSR